MENSTTQLSMARNENDVHSPADVIKELVNIALAAGANLITVEIFNGGITEFRVSDNAPKFFPEEISPFVKLQETATSAQRGTLLWQRIGYLLREIVPFADVEIAGKSCSGTKTIALHYYHGKYLRQYRTTATIRITGRPFCKNQLGRPCFCSQERTDSSCQAGSVSQDQIR